MVKDSSIPVEGEKLKKKKKNGGNSSGLRSGRAKKSGNAH